MVELRGRYYKYAGKKAESIVKDYSDGMLVKDIIKKYNMSTGSLYGLLRRVNVNPRLRT